jgi:hypothetical protein
MCHYYLRQKRMTLTEVEHVCGVFDYCLDIVPTGKAFNLVFYRLKSHYFGRNGKTPIPISDEIKESLQWWSYSLASRPIRHLLSEYWWSSCDAEEVLFTDASTKTGLGIYRWTQKKAYKHSYDTFTEIYAVLNGPRKDAKVHINTMELLAVLSAAQLLGGELQLGAVSMKKRLVIMCDNSSVCEAIGKLKTDDFIMKELLKDLTEELRYLDIRVCHISGEYNPADWLTRSDKLEEFPRRFDVDSITTFVPPCLNDYYSRAKIRPKI